MKFEQFSRDIKNEKFNIVFAKGNDAFLLSKVIEKVKANLKIELPDLNIASFDNDNFEFNNFLNSCEQLPMIDECRLVIVKNFTNKMSADDVKKMTAYSFNPVPSTIVVITAFDQNSNWDFLKGQKGFVDCNKLSLDNILKFIVSQCKKSEKQISQQAATLLAKNCLLDLLTIENSILKLAAYDLTQQLITVEMVEKLVEENNDWIVFELTDALVNKNSDKAFMMIFNMIREKKDAWFSVLSLISNHFRRLLHVSISSLTDFEMANILGMKEYAVKKAREQKGKFSASKLKQIVDLCCLTEYEIKSGKRRPENAVTFLVVTILDK